MDAAGRGVRKNTGDDGQSYSFMDSVNTKAEHWHGTVNGYSNHECRCYECRKAWSLKCRLSGYRKSRGRSRDALTIEQLQALAREQHKCCAICECPLGGNGSSKSCIDHDHETGKVRGLLCSRCNMGLGHFLDEPIFLERAIDYLAHHAAVVLSQES